MDKVKLKSVDHYLVLTVVVIIIVLLMCDDPVQMLLIISLMVNIYLYTSKTTEKATSGNPPVTDLTPPYPKQYMDSDANIPPQDMNIYGQAYADWDKYRKVNCSGGVSGSGPSIGPKVFTNCAERSLSIDAENALLGQQRARDKRCTDGWASKTSNFYKYHYSNELDVEEAKPWWGRTDF